MAFLFASRESPLFSVSHLRTEHGELGSVDALPRAAYRFVLEEVP